MFEDYVSQRPAIDDIRPWPSQSQGLDATLAAVREGRRRICVTSPTGGGKTWIMAKVAMAALSMEWGVTIYANRKLLIEQLKRSLSAYGLSHGVRAAGHGVNSEPFQIASLQTEYSRAVKRKVRSVHRSGLVIVDEAHVNNNPSARKVLKEHLDNGAYVVGFTATPLGLDGAYDTLIQAGTVSELQGYGALVRAVHYGCTEPELVNIRRIPVGEEISEDRAVKLIMVPGIHGRVIEHYRRLNPHGLPSIGFAPGVPESVGFAEAFEAAGIPAAHIDGDRVWLGGEEFPSTEDTRSAVLKMSRTGQVRIVWNRFVLREAIDLPWLRHGVLATVFGSLQSYLQSCGRGLRSCPDALKDRFTLQDHGGNWWRHGSLNADRHWHLGDTERALAEERRMTLGGDTDTEPKVPEPFLCPRCAAIIVLPREIEDRIGSRIRCHACGYEFDFRRRSRPVIQSDGELVEHTGRIFERRRVEKRPDTLAKWKRCYYRARNSKCMNFNQAVGIFVRDHHYWPPRNLPLMPRATLDWHRLVCQVPRGELVPEDGP